MQLPREARWSRPSSIAFSVIVHVAVLVALRHFVWVPLVEKDAPVFTLFQLDAPKETPPPIAAPVIEKPVLPPVAVTPPPQSTTREDERPVTAQPEFVPQLTTPNEVPSTLPQPGAAVQLPTLTAPRVPLTAAERLREGALRTGIGYIPGPYQPNAIPRPLTAEEAATARLYAGMREYNDSVAAARRAGDHSQDWVKTDKDGGKWGVSPTAIHIGSVTLPLPNFQFAGPSGRREETAAKLRTFAEANAQASRMETEETFEKRVKAMRARKDAARADSAKAKKTGH